MDDTTFGERIRELRATADPLPHANRGDLEVGDETNGKRQGADPVRFSGPDRVIAELWAVRDEYSAGHGHDIGAIFADVRAMEEASGPKYARWDIPSRTSPRSSSK